MAVPAGPTEARYVGNGVTTVFTIPFLLIIPTDLDVFLNGVEQTSGYVITGAGNPTSTITFTTAPAVGADVYLALNVPFERLNDYQENGDFLSSTVNRDFDRIWQALKQLFRGATRALTLGSTDVDGSGWYRAKGNGIRGLADPVQEQDAVNYRSMRTMIEQALAGVVGGVGWFIQAGTGAIARTFQGKMRDSVSVKDFGAVGDGVIDDTIAFQLAADTGRPVFMPDGEYALSARINAKSLFSGNGSKTRVVFTHGGDGFMFAPSETSILAGIIKCQILCKGSNGGKAIETERDAKHYTKLQTQYLFDNLVVQGYTPTPRPTDAGANWRVEAWSCCFQIADTWGTIIDRISSMGNFDISIDPTGQFQSVFVRMDAASAALNVRVTRVNGAFHYRFAELGERIFYHFDDIDSSTCFDGIIQTATSNVFGESRITNVNVNAQNEGFSLINVGSRQFCNNTARRHRTGWKGATQGFVGFRFRNVSFSQLVNIEATQDESDGAFSGARSYGVFAENCTGPSISGLVIGGRIDTGLRADNCIQLDVNRVTSNQNKADAVLFDLRANTRNSHIGSYVLSSGFVGEVLVRDGTITQNALTMLQRNVVPESGSPTYWFRQLNALLNEKVARLIKSGSTLNLQFMTDDEQTSTNALVMTRSGTTAVSFDVRFQRLLLNAGPAIITGTGSPEGIVTAPVGSIYLRTNGAAGTTFHVKESGTGNTGWSAK